jgi:hypothetical protein
MKFGIWCISNYASQTVRYAPVNAPKPDSQVLKKPMKIRKDYYVLLVCVCVCVYV